MIKTNLFLVVTCQLTNMYPLKKGALGAIFFETSFSLLLLLVSKHGKTGEKLLKIVVPQKANNEGNFEARPSNCYRCDFNCQQQKQVCHSGTDYRHWKI
jgi:hypothetical protein